MNKDWEGRKLNNQKKTKTIVLLGQEQGCPSKKKTTKQNGKIKQNSNFLEFLVKV